MWNDLAGPRPVKWRLAVLAVLGVTSCSPPKPPPPPPEPCKAVPGTQTCCDENGVLQAWFPSSRGGCAPPADAPGNSCATAELLSVPEDGGQLNVRGSTEDLLDSVSCCGAEGERCPPLVTRDHLYRFTLSHQQVFHARVSIGFNLHLTDACPSNFGDLRPYRCGSGAYGALPKIFRVRDRLDVVLPAGSYTLWVEAAANAREHGYGLSAWASELPLGLSCSAPIVVTLDGGYGRVRLDLDDYAMFRPPPARGDRELASLCFVVPPPEQTPARITATLRGLQSCGFPNCEWVRSDVLGAQTFEFTTTEFVPLQIDVVARFVPGTCRTPLPLTFVADGGVETAFSSGNTSEGELSDGGSCFNSQYLTYPLTLTEPRTVIAHLTSLSASYAPALELRGSDCDAAGGPCAVGDGTSAELDAGMLPAGNYFLRVGGAEAFVATADGGTIFAPTAGPFDLEVTLAP